MSVFGHSKIHSGHSTFSFPKSTIFLCFVPAISTSVYKKKLILMKSLMPIVDSNNNQYHTQPNATTATKDWMQQQQQSSKFDAKQSG
jgi:hypothetical protein